MRTLFLSGYTEDEVLRQGVRTASVQFLEKPYTAQGLLVRVRKILDSQDDQALVR
jgi:FixJ family two-component response regulator